MGCEQSRDVRLSVFFLESAVAGRASRLLPTEE
jgi:hypothetical protein